MNCRLLVPHFLLLTFVMVQANAAERLQIGSKAPAIEIEHWFHDKEPIAEFEADKVFVVEFWATWCGPCVASMPHLRDIQEKHGDDICVISVSDEPPETIEKFLDREHSGTTFREITSRYWLTTDPDGSVKRDYMTAADQRGIPTAFIVGKTGEIEWIGHPMRIDDPLARILAGEWDRAAYAKQMEEKEEVGRQLRLVFEKVRQNKPAEALPMLDRLIAEAPSPEVRSMYESAQRSVRSEIDKLAQVSRGQDVTPSPNPEPGLVRESSCPGWGLKGFSDEEATQYRADRGPASAG